MDMKKLMEQAQQMQKQLEKSMSEYDAKLFHFDYKGLVSIDIYGSLQIKSINVEDKSIIDANDTDTLSDVITQCVNNAINAVIKGKTEITNRIAGPAAQGLF